MEMYHVTIQGIAPLLIHAFADDFGLDNKVAKKKKGSDHGTPREQAEKALYAEKNGLLYIPSTWIKGSLMDVASEYKLPGSRKSLKSVLGGAVIPLDEKMSFSKKFFKKDIEIDSRPVSIQRANSKIMRHRGRIEIPWKLSCDLQIETSIVPAETVHELLGDAGRRAGIGDFRPSKQGPFGRYQVSNWTKRRN